MAKLNISDFDKFKFETELVSESFYTTGTKAEIALRCTVKPITNEIEYYVLVLVQHTFYKVYKFVFLEDAIIGYNDRLKEIEGEKDVG